MLLHCITSHQTFYITSSFACLQQKLLQVCSVLLFTKSLLEVNWVLLPVPLFTHSHHRHRHHCQQTKPPFSFISFYITTIIWSDYVELIFLYLLFHITNWSLFGVQFQFEKENEQLNHTKLKSEWEEENCESFELKNSILSCAKWWGGSGLRFGKHTSFSPFWTSGGRRAEDGEPIATSLPFLSIQINDERAWASEQKRGAFHFRYSV